MRCLSVFLILIFLISGCIFPFKKGGSKEIAQIRELTDGKYIISNDIPAGWWVKIGDREKNADLKNEFLEIYVINDDNTMLLFYTSHGDRTISPGKKLKWFSGTFEELWSNPSINATSTGHVKYTIVIQFKNKNLKIHHPIPVIAWWGSK